MISSYRQLTLEKYDQILQIAKQEGVEEIDKQVAILSVLSDKTEQDILNLPISEYKEMVVKSKFLEGIDRTDSFQSADEYNIGSFRLIPLKDFTKMTAGQYIDYQTFSKDADNRIAEILSCFLIPKGCKYNDGYDIVEVQKSIKRYMNVHDALSVSAFFLNSYVRLTKDSLTFSRRVAKKMKNKEQREKMLQKIEEQEVLLKNAGLG